MWNKGLQNVRRFFARLAKPFRFIVIFLLITGWVFSGFPQIFNFPPEVQVVRAAATFPTQTVGSGVQSPSSVAHTSPAGTDTLLIVMTGGFNDPPTAINWNTSEALTKLVSSSNGEVNADIWYRVNPTSGAKSATFTGGSEQHVVVMTFHGVDQTNPFGATPDTNTNSAGGSPPDPNVTITTAADNMTVEVVGWVEEDNEISPTNGSSVEDYDSFNDGEIEPRAAFSHTDSTGAISVGWGSTDQTGWAMSVADILGAAADPTFTQNTYRWYVDNNTANPTAVWGTPDLAENTAITIVPAGNDPPSNAQELRLRVNFTVNTANLAVSSQQFQVQFKAGTDTNCTTGTWTDVGDVAASAWQFATSGVTDGADITEVLSTTTATKGEEYSKTNFTQTNHVAANTGEVIEYDFHIIGSGSAFAETTQYSFRVIESAGTIFDAYTNCPTLTTEPGTQALMRHGNTFADGVEQGFFWAN